MPLAQTMSESVHSMAMVDHSSGNDADASSLETDETILSMVFNNSKLSVEAMMPNNVKNVKLRVTQLQYINVVIHNVKCKDLCDSGAQIPMINKRLVGGNAGSFGTVQDQGVVGDPVQAELVSLNVSCCPDGDGKCIDVNGPTEIVFAVTDCMTGCDVILQPTICDELRTAKPFFFMPIPNANCVGVNKLPDSVILMNQKLTNSQFSQIEFHTTKHLSSLDIAMLSDKTVSPSTVTMTRLM